MYTRHGHWFSATGQPPVSPFPAPLACGGLSQCQQCRQDALSEQMLVAHNQVTNPDPARGNAPVETYETAPAKTPVVLVDASPIADWVERYNQLKAAEDEIKSRVAEARDRLLQFINAGTAANAKDVKLTVNGVPVIRRQLVSQDRIDSRRLKSDYPALAAAYSKTTTSERVTIP